MSRHRLITPIQTKELERVTRQSLDHSKLLTSNKQNQNNKKKMIILLFLTILFGPIGFLFGLIRCGQKNNTKKLIRAINSQAKPKPPWKRSWL
jgi:hypothetical protein